MSNTQDTYHQFLNLIFVTARVRREGNVFTGVCPSTEGTLCLVPFESRGYPSLCSQVPFEGGGYPSLWSQVPSSESQYLFLWSQVPSWGWVPLDRTGVSPIRKQPESIRHGQYMGSFQYGLQTLVPGKGLIT